MEYVELADIQKVLTEYYKQTGSCLTMPMAIKKIYQQGTVLTDEKKCPFPQRMFGISDDEYINFFGRAHLPVDYIIREPSSINWRETPYLNLRNRHYIRVYKHFNYNYIESVFHTHKHFEVVFVLKGQCEMVFEKISLSLKSGDVCIIAPGSQHGISIMDDSSFVLNMIISKPAFETIFVQILQDGDLVSRYLQSMLYLEDVPNYLFVRTSNSDELKFFYQIRHLRGPF